MLSGILIISMNYNPDMDIAILVRVEEVMDEMGFGPNGGLVYAMQFLYKHILTGLSAEHGSRLDRLDH